MKRLSLTLLVGLSAVLLLNGCIGLHIGSGDKRTSQNATVGQQLIDLKTAKDTGAITEAEYQTQKAKLLNGQ